MTVKWVLRISETLISMSSAVIFFFLDILDVFMCVLFRYVDEYWEGKHSQCYCTTTQNIPNSCAVDELSETLHGRKNIIREMGFIKVPRICSKEEEAFCVEKKNRWSDCGCESCVSWITNGTDSKLHLVVQPPQTDKMENSYEEAGVQNVIFIHGFLSSSSLWEQTVFPNISGGLKHNYRLFAVDLLGFGRSPKPRDCFYTLRDHLQMIEKSVIVPFQLNSFHLVAHSMGCVIALALAANYSESVKSITLVAPPYFISSEGNASSEALKKLAPRRIWPPLLFGSAFMSWYEHLGRCICFFVCRNHRTWEWILKKLTGKRDLPFVITDITRHTHHSAWHTMHNVICGGAKFVDKYLEVLRGAGVKIYVVQGSKDEVVPLECSLMMKMKAPEIELEIVQNGDHNSVIIGRSKEFTSSLERLWSENKKQRSNYNKPQDLC